MGKNEGGHMDASGTHLWLVLGKAYRALRQHAERSLEGIDMCLSDFSILELLLNRGPQPVITLGQRINLTSGSVTTAVDRLEERGLVLRNANPGDRRSRLVSLTPDGTRCIADIFDHHRSAMDRAAEGLTKSERKTLIDLVKKLGRAADEQLTETGRHE
jgi:MarR family transcriptional regulator, 2-MHQ and catechol-resistance regulon repressor